MTLEEMCRTLTDEQIATMLHSLAVPFVSGMTAEECDARRLEAYHGLYDMLFNEVRRRARVGDVIK